MKVLFIRHGQTVINIQGRIHQVNDEAGLTEIGKRQAERTAEACQKQGVEAIYSSPELRAVETAKIIGSAMGIKPIIEPDLAERNRGEWSQKIWEEIQSQLRAMSLEERYSFAPPKGESWQQMEKRLKVSLDELVKKPYKVIAIVTHAGAMRALMPVLKSEPKESSFNYDFLNGSITSFNYKNGRWHLINENDVNHLASREH